MNNCELREEINQFEEIFRTFEMLVKYRKRLGMPQDQMAIDLCAFYAIWGAHKVLRCVGAICDIQTGSDLGEDAQKGNYRELFEQGDSVHGAGQDLLLAVAERERTAALTALERMGVLSFCPIPERVFSRMEEVASRVGERAKPVFRVDLALFAASCGDFQQAYRFVQQARSLGLSSRELYDSFVVEGLIALNDERVGDAIQCLDRSMVACQADVDSSIQCSLVPPNLELARMLLERGETIAVLRYLGECKNVWQLYGAQIEEWIRSIERGNKPEFRSAEVAAADRLSRRLNVRWMRACSLEMQLIPPRPTTPQSPSQVLAERERRRAEYQPRVDAYIKRKLEYLEKDLDVARDRKPSDPGEPAEPSSEPTV